MGWREDGEFSGKCPPISIVFHSLPGFQKVTGGKGEAEGITEAQAMPQRHGTWTVLGREVGYES